MESRSRRVRFAFVAALVLVPHGAAAGEPPATSMAAATQPAANTQPAATTRPGPPTTRPAALITPDPDTDAYLSLAKPYHYGLDLELKSADGLFTLVPAFHGQFRETLRSKVGDAHPDIDSDLDLRRARPDFRGYVLTPDFTYHLQFEFAHQANLDTFLDYEFKYAFTPDLALRFGQYKERIFHERDVSIFRQQTIDRSITDSYLGGGNIDRVRGIAGIVGGSKDNPFRLEITLHNGDVQNPLNAPSVAGARFGVGARLEWKPFGGWYDYNQEFTARYGRDPLFVIGLGSDTTQRGDNDETRSVIDAMLKTPDRTSVFAALHSRYVDIGDPRYDQGHRLDYGAMLQAAHAFTPAWEIYARYALIQFDRDFVRMQEMTLGLNHYLGPNGAWSHKAKLSLDLVYLPDGAPSSVNPSGILRNDTSELLLRTQLQFGF